MRNGRGRWERVLEARRQARDSLGRDPNVEGDLFDGPPRPSTPFQAPKPIEPRPDPYGVVIGALAPGEAAERLGVSRAQLEAMIAAGKVETVGEWTKFIPVSEVERLTGVSSEPIHE